MEFRGKVCHSISMFGREYNDIGVCVVVKETLNLIDLVHNVLIGGPGVSFQLVGQH